MKEEPINNGIAGTFLGYRLHGKSYDAQGNLIEEEHEKDCFCCRENLLIPNNNKDE